MGYNLYITRAESWTDARQAPIARAEWDAVVAEDPELEWSKEDWYERQEKPKRERLPNGAVVTSRPEKSAVERIFAVVWKAHAKPVAFWYKGGAITTKNPDKETAKKLVELAARLDAQVLGEEDEQYLADGTSVP